LDKPITINRIDILAGFFDPRWFKNNNRVKTLKIIINKKDYIVNLQDDMKVQRINFNTHITFENITFIILDVYKSNVDNDTAISEIYFYKDNTRIPVDLSHVEEFNRKITEKEILNEKQK
jgi:hypothetical protein